MAGQVLERRSRTASHAATPASFMPASSLFSRQSSESTPDRSLDATSPALAAEPGSQDIGMREAAAPILDPVLGHSLSRFSIQRRQATPAADPPPAPSATSPTTAVVGPCFQKLSVRQAQAKLTVNEPGDSYEKEADAVSSQVLRMDAPEQGDTPQAGAATHAETAQREPREESTEVLDAVPVEAQEDPEAQRAMREEEPSASPDSDEEDSPAASTQGDGTVQRKCDACAHEEEAHPAPESPTLSRAADGDISPEADVSEAVSGGLQSGGQPLDAETREYMEPRFGHDFSQVRVHTDADASASTEAVAARAYTVGSDIAFRAGEYSPGSSQGRQLLAHELTHTIQQGGASPVKRRMLHRKPLKPDRNASPTATRGPPQGGAESNSSNTSGPKESGADAFASGTSKQPRNDQGSPTSSFNTSRSTQEGSSGTSGSGDTGLRPGALPTAEPGARGGSAPGPGASSHETAGQGAAADIATAPGPEGHGVIAGHGAGGGSAATATATAGGGAPAGGAGASSEGAGGAPGGDAAPKAAGAETERAPAIDVSSAIGALTSLTSTPASLLVAALGQVEEAIPGLQSREKTEAEANYPTTPQPTGLATTTPATSAAAPLSAKGQAPEPPNAAGAGAAKPADSRAPEPHGPVPGSQVSTSAGPAPKKDEEGGWWSWLTNRVKSFVGSLPTRDAGLITNAGAAPKVDLNGDADPTRNTQYKQQTDQEAARRKAESDGAAHADFGEGKIGPTLPVAVLKPTYKPIPAPAAPGGGKAQLPQLTEEERAQFDQANSAQQQAKIQQETGKYKTEQETHKQATLNAQQAGSRRITEENDKARTQQEGLKQQTKAEIGGERQRWQAENKKLQDDYHGKAEARRGTVHQEVQEKATSADQAAGKKLTDAETQAQTEQRKTESEAAAQKRDIDSKPKSFWDGVKDSISSVFDKVKQAINGLFEKLRQTVKSIIEAAKSAVHALIDAVRNAIIGLIKAFAEYLKSLINVLLAAFPELAAKARAWIDAKVKQAEEAINKLADLLKKAADAILDFVAKTIDSLLSALQAAFNAILAAIKFIVMAPILALEAAGDLLEKARAFKKVIEAVEAAVKNPGPILAEISAKIGTLIEGVGAKAKDTAMKALQAAGLSGGEAGAGKGGSAVTPAPAASGGIASGGVQRAPANGLVQRTPSGGRIQRAPAKPGLPPAFRNSGLDAKGDGAPGGPDKRAELGSPVFQNHVGAISALVDAKFEDIGSNILSFLGKLLLDIVFPIPSIITNVIDGAKALGEVFENIFSAPSKAITSLLKVEQHWLAIVGLIFVPIALGISLAGAIAGTPVVGAAVLAAMSAIGLALLAAFLLTEVAVIAKAIFDLSDNTEKDEKKFRENNVDAYNRISDSVITTEIGIAMVIIAVAASEIAGLAAKSLRARFGNSRAAQIADRFFNGPKAPGDKPEEKPGAKAGELPALKEGSSVDGKRTIRITEKSVEVCAACPDIHGKYAEETKSNPKLAAEQAKVDAIEDPATKLKEEKPVEQKLADAQKSTRNTEALQTKLDRLNTSKTEAKGAVDQAENTFRTKEVGDLRADPAAKKTLASREADLDVIDRELAQVNVEADGVRDVAKDPSLADLAREEADAVENKYKDIESRAKAIKDKTEQEVTQDQESKKAKQAETEAAQNTAQEGVDKVKNTCDETDGTNREPSVGDGTSEAALDAETQTGNPVAGKSHALKCAEGIRALNDALAKIAEGKNAVTDPVKKAEIAASEARANDRINRMRPAVERWNRRVKDHPNVWNKDGTSRRTPGFPKDPGPV